MSVAQLKIAIAGANGRMGRALVQAISQRQDCILSGALSHEGSDAIGLDAGFTSGIETGVSICHDPEKVLDNTDILIDFTRPDSTLAYLDICTRLGVNCVIGTTGLNEEQINQMHTAAEKIGIVFAPNFSVGVNLTFALLDTAARILRDDYDIEIIEAHHRHKVDAPSGTALHMGEVIAHALGRDLKSCAVYGRKGHTGERDAQTIGFSTIRAGDIVGEHTAMFATEGEQLEITHKASNRATFAQGAVRSALWLNRHRGTGLFDMQDVLGLK
ncbi:4-hydroxy-tetrahydrodipicolinate reductase [Neisseriaceae bacterium ESL0693]|nr:4-hydroxy-tetrahydrodipicolinate reductase [Neisseriaceae bacterium ESL0693]